MIISNRASPWLLQTWLGKPLSKLGYLHKGIHSRRVVIGRRSWILLNAARQVHHHRLDRGSKFSEACRLLLDLHGSQEIQCLRVIQPRRLDGIKKRYGVETFMGCGSQRPRLLGRTLP